MADMSSTRNNAPTTLTPPHEGEGKDRNTNRKVGGIQLRSRKRGGSIYLRKLNVSLFEGTNKNIGVVLGLRTARLIKKVLFDIFQYKLVEYVVTSLTHGGQIRVGMNSMEDTTPFFENKHNPKPIKDEENRMSENNNTERNGNILLKESTWKCVQFSLGKIY